MKYTGPDKNIYQLTKYSPDTKTGEVINIPWVHYDAQSMLETEDGMIWLTGFNQLLLLSIRIQKVCPPTT
ncbi:MAG: hypothetical protein IPM82_26705 [Saprospiraceae bacterium]|nr:hypothetical protein [Saprospiraceae bacterium]